MPAVAKRAMKTFGSEAWFSALAALTASLGSDSFHRRLVEAFGLLIPHSASWIIQYSRGAAPNVIFTKDVPERVLNHYNAKCRLIDPFSAHWALTEQPGVKTLRQFEAARGEVDATEYSALFKPAANITDELGIFFSTVGHASIGVFLERETGFFRPGEVELAEAVFPLLDGFHAAHNGRLFAKLRRPGGLGDDQLADRPMLIRDRRGLEIMSTPAWRSAVANGRSIERALKACEVGRPSSFGPFILKKEVLSDYFPLAPGGAIYILLDEPQNRNLQGGTEDAAVLARSLTPQEAAVFQFIMTGTSTGEIAQRLAISKRAVLNYRVKIYRKAGVHSERALVQKFGAATAPAPAP